MNKLHKGILWGLVVNIPVWVAMIFILISVNNMLVSIKPETDDFAVWKAELYRQNVRDYWLDRWTQGESCPAKDVNAVDMTCHLCHKEKL